MEEKKQLKDKPDTQKAVAKPDAAKTAKAPGASRAPAGKSTSPKTSSGEKAPGSKAPVRTAPGTRPASRPVTTAPSSPAHPATKPASAPKQVASNAPARPTPPARPLTGKPVPSGSQVKPGLTPRQGPPATGPRPTVQGRGVTGAGGTAVAPAVPPKPAAPAQPIVVELSGMITVRDLAVKFKVTPIDIIKKLMANGVMANINQPIDFDTAVLIGGELGFEVREERQVVEQVAPTILSSMPKKHEYSDEELKHVMPRPPVVTVMGHVDHGKTSLLDAIRKSNVVAGEYGGITQHIGAYQVEHDGKRITFLDTPGHEAFTAMRARGAKVTDEAIIVVAADDGVMPQTREAIDHARAAQVPIIVALNKIDRPTANPERVKQQLNDIGLEVYGGQDQVTVVPVSAKQHTGIDELLDNILLVAELADLRSNPQASPRGVVIEAKLDKQQGPMATLLVQEGTLHVGDVVLAGESYGKVRAMFDQRGESVTEAAPATPVAVTGLSDVPPAGDTFTVVAAEQIARARVNERTQARRASMVQAPPITLNDLYARFQEGHIKELNLVIKADVDGSLEPIVSSLEKLSDEKLKVKIIHQGIGAVTTSDIMLAAASQGIVIAFTVGVEPAAQTLSEQEHVDLRSYNIIYKLIEDVDKALKGMLEPVYKDVVMGRSQVLQLFHVKKTTVAGSRVIQGRVTRGTTAHVMRAGTEIFSGGIASLKRHTEDVKEVAEGYEFGLSLDSFNAFKEGDIVEFSHKERVS